MTIVHVPRGLKGLAPIPLDLTSILRTESRIMEVATVTPMKAPELMATFNVAFLECNKMIALLEQEYVMAKRQSDKVRSVVILDRAPRVLAERGLVTAKNPAGSEDLRRSVLDGDEEYQTALQLVSDIACYLELLKGKQKGIEMAYTSVKKLFGERTFNYGSDLSAGGEGNATAGQVVGMGRPRY